MPGPTEDCGRCAAPLVAGANYCHACGVSVTASVTGEYEIFDLDRFFTYAVDMLCVAGTDGYFKRVNPAFERTLGYSAAELLAAPFVEFVHPADREGTVAEVGKLSGGQATLSFENRYRHKDGTYRDLQWTSYPEPGTGLLYAVARDVTHWKRHQDRVDALTELASRRVFDEQVPAEWNRARRSKAPLTVAFFDLDDFRGFNERYGYGAGDRCLVEVSRLVRGIARRAGDTAARYAGQEFGVLFHEGVGAAEARTLCEKVRAAVEALPIPADAPGSLTLSAGIASMVPADGKTHRDLVEAGRAALAQAKEAGRNRVLVLGG